MWKSRNHLFKRDDKRRKTCFKNMLFSFTLIEVVVALTILGTAIIAVFGVLHVCSTAAHHTRMLTRAVLLAEALFTEVRLSENAVFETKEGQEDLYRWKVQIVPTPIEGLGAVQVQVKWQEQQRQQQYDLLSLVQMKSFSERR